MLKLIIRLSAFTIGLSGLSYATPSCHVLQQSQLANLNDRMNQMISSLYAPFLAKQSSTSSSSTSPAPSSSSEYTPSTYESQPCTYPATYPSNYPPPPTSTAPQVIYVSSSQPPTPTAVQVSGPAASNPTVTITSSTVPGYYSTEPASTEYSSYITPKSSWYCYDTNQYPPNHATAQPSYPSTYSPAYPPQHTYQPREYYTGQPSYNYPPPPPPPPSPYPLQPCQSIPPSYPSYPPQSSPSALYPPPPSSYPSSAPPPYLPAFYPPPVSPYPPPASPYPPPSSVYPPPPPCSYRVPTNPRYAELPPPHY